MSSMRTPTNVVGQRVALDTYELQTGHPTNDAFRSWRLLLILRSRIRKTDVWRGLAPDLRDAINYVLDGENATQGEDA